MESIVKDDTISHSHCSLCAVLRQFVSQSTDLCHKNARVQESRKGPHL